MTVQERVMICNLIETIDKHKDLSEKLGLVNVSFFNSQENIITKKGTKKKDEKDTQ